MGRHRVGEASGLGRKGCPLGCTCGRHRQRDTGPSSVSRAFLDAGTDTRFQRKYPPPSAGDRFGELTVVGAERQRRGACDLDMVRVQCSCGAPPHLVFDYNLRKGASTRCAVCARKAAGFWRKKYHGYADIVPDADHRVRLLGRISAAINRCHNPNDTGYPNYGERGIQVHAPWREDRRQFLAYLAALPGWDDPLLEMDRRDVNRGYEPGNLRFITKQENRANQRTVLELQRRIADLEARLRLAERRPAESVHGDDFDGSADRP